MQRGSRELPVNCSLQVDYVPRKLTVNGALKCLLNKRDSELSETKLSVVEQQSKAVKLKRIYFILFLMHDPFVSCP